MGYVPKFIHLDHFIVVEYPFGIHWKHSYIQQSAEAIFNTYKEDIEEGTSITFVARGTSGAMIAGAMLNELHNINPTTKTYILIVRKEEDTSAHCSSLRGIDEVGTTRVKESCITYVRRLRRHMRSSFLVHSTSQLVYTNQERLQSM